MGMSASQARLIALTARMADLEYEGQQINQQRLTLTNKMSEIYEQMTNMIVPTPPSKIDFASDQYTGNAGGADITVKMGDDGRPHAYETVKGPVVKKTMGTKGGSQKINLQDVAAVEKGAKDNTFEVVEEDTTPEFYVSTTTIKVADKSQLYVPKEGLVYYDAEKAKDQFGFNVAGWYYNNSTREEDPFTVAETITDGTKYFTSDGLLYGTAGTDFVDKDTVVAAFSGDDKTGFTKLESLSHNQEVHVGYSEQPQDESCVAVADAKDTANGLDSIDDLYIVDENGKATKVTEDMFDKKDGKYYLKDLNANIKKPGGSEEFVDGSASSGKTVTDASGKTGSVMTIEEAKQEFGEDNSGFNTALTALNNKFPGQEGEFQVVSYPDGKFAFVLTTDYDADDSSVYVYEPGTGDYDQELENGNYKITYDDNGRINGIEMPDGSKGALNTTQAYDELKYDKAMAAYTADKAEYDRQQNELNKKTSIYQRQDKQLDLKLKRLDTERNALNTEIDAVKKVIQDATDKGFKTFSG